MSRRRMFFANLIPLPPPPPLPYATYAHFEQAAFRVPVMPGLQTIAFWVRRARTQDDPAMYLVDNRPDGNGFFIGTDRSNVQAYAGGADQTAVYDLQKFFREDATWVKVVLQSSGFSAAPYLFSRYTGGSIPNMDIADLRTYTRAFTPSELADAAGPLPGDAISRYDFQQLTPTLVLDQIGTNHLTILGTSGTSYS